MTVSPNDEVYEKFNKAVNMTASELEAFLKTEDSKKVGQKFGAGSESIGHQSGRHIVQILKKNKTKLTSDDYAHMKKVSSYVARHSAQGGPAKDREHSYWRYSLMNWGHDPLK